MDHQRFQSAVLIVLCGVVVMLAALVWSQNLAIENISRAIETLSRSGTVSAPYRPEAPAAPEPVPAPAP